MDAEREVLLKKALAEYASTIKKKGSRAGEPIITKWEKDIPDFRRWAYGLGILLRSDELLKKAMKKRRENHRKKRVKNA